MEEEELSYISEPLEVFRNQNPKSFEREFQLPSKVE